jgi:hypothetical protein
MSEATMQLMAAMHTAGVLRPHELRAAVQRHAPFFGDHGQHDAQVRERESFLAGV